MTAPARVTSGRVALVTGASSGIGEATARRLAQRGYTTYAAARRISRMDALRDQGIHTVPVDVTDDTSLIALVEQVIAESGRIDVLVNNAGRGQDVGADGQLVSRHEVRRRGTQRQPPG
jgi:NADP-dependent 3-hydroxy acid dehydrogenase YdfG